MHCFKTISTVSDSAHTTASNNFSNCLSHFQRARTRSQKGKGTTVKVSRDTTKAGQVRSVKGNLHFMQATVKADFQQKIKDRADRA